MPFRLVIYNPFRMTTLKRLWQLDDQVTFLNHGSFGACPTAILEVQSELRRKLESEPVRFMVRELEGLLDEARASLSAFVGCSTSHLVFVPNATYAINSVLRSMKLQRNPEKSAGGSTPEGCGRPRPHRAKLNWVHDSPCRKFPDSTLAPFL